MNIRSKIFLGLLICLFFSTSMSSQDTKQLEGRWDMVVSKDGTELPSWLEIRHSGYKTLVGRFVYAFGSARPISEIKLNGDKFSFAIPKQWEQGKGDLEFEGQFNRKAIKRNNDLY